MVIKLVKCAVPTYTHVFGLDKSLTSNRVKPSSVLTIVTA